MNHTVYAVFGNPVLHSKSPQLFSPLIDRQDDAFYTRIRPQSTEDLANIVRSLDIRGASITSPFKESTLSFIDKVHPAALEVGAVNCIRQKNGYIEGDNTDHAGVTGALREAGAALQGLKVLVLGAGGAAKAAVYGLVHAGAKVTISNRTFDKAERLAASFDCETIRWESSRGHRHFHAVVSALLPEAIPPFIDSLGYDVLLDAIYKPSAITAFSKNKGIPVIGGEQWLIHQGTEAAAFYIGNKPEPAILAQKLHEKPDRNKLQIFTLTRSSMQHFCQSTHDLVISGFGLDETTITHLINEEKELAFGS